ncbi:MAG: pilus assembly protein, partial [Chloroflexota bacterium]
MAVLKGVHSSRARGDHGQSLVEFALVVPLLTLLFLMVLGASDLSRLFYYSTGITNAAREGARHGAYYDPLATTPGNTFATDAAILSAVSAEGSYLSLTEP